jgi:hypothetical protein
MRLVLWLFARGMEATAVSLWIATCIITLRLWTMPSRETTPCGSLTQARLVIH